ncbi:hypothetical protein [Alistipes sp. An116]|uniref:hypothetical protein n=1 Tax=Alistipes sp. An116 TaxID=1965546 RepID=UPI00117817B9|nr:hypothetical protein [Alistipes sp. An116]
MEIVRIEPTEKVKPFLKGLRLPSQFNGKINKIEFIQYCTQNDACVGAETCKRFQDVYNTIAGARLSVALAQIKEFPEFIQQNEWGYNWMRSRYATDAILLYEASFDLILQIPWIFFQIYKLNDSSLDLRKNLASILKACRLRNRVDSQTGKIVAFGLEDNINSELYSLLKEFNNKNNHIISQLANYIKHKQCISFKELKLQNSFVVLGRNYNSESSLVEHSLDEIIVILKGHHMKLIKLCEDVQSFFPF